MDKEIIEKSRAKARLWLKESYDAETRRQVEAIMGNPDSTELVNSFYKDLEFGTGGLRGIMGVGSNRMNTYTVGKATQGFANYIKRLYPDEKNTVCIGYDCRHLSEEFAKTTAAVFAANDIDVYIFDALRPTPEISFAIRELGCRGGVIITASHNPKEYNGYKAYWDDGSQLVPPHDKAVIEEVKKISAEEVKFKGGKGKISLIGAEMDAKFLDTVKKLSLLPEIIRKTEDLKIVFTALHGTTYKMVPESLRKWGFKNIYPVPEQCTPDGDFPTVVSANPEEPASFRMAIELAREKDADLAMACDPDGDRIGVAVKNEKGEWFILNGNQTNLLYTWYLIKMRKRKGLTGKEDYTVKTIVTSELIKEVAEKNGITCYDVYTGFKWIAAKIRDIGPEGFIGAGEESFGFMPGTFTRDKDGVSSASLMAEIAAWAKSEGIGLFELLKSIYAEYGFSQERMIYIVREGVSGANEIRNMMERFRKNPPEKLNGKKVVLRKDFTLLKAYDTRKAITTDLEFPDKSNVLQYFLEDGSKISIRPSGTEPKIKFYFEAKAEMKKDEDFRKAEKEANAEIDALIKEITA